MNTQEYFRAVASLLRPEVLARRCAGVVGLGSGGSRVAESLARNGIGKFALLDLPGETLEEHNLVRHTLTYRELGRRKLAAMRERLRAIYPRAVVRTKGIDVVNERMRAEAFLRKEGADIVLACADTESSRHAVNQIALGLGVPMVFASVFSGGIGGQVGRVRPGEACYGCIARYLDLRVTADEERSRTVDYSHPDDPALRSTPALNLDIDQIALLQARWALLTLLEGSGVDLGAFPGNYLVFGNRASEGHFAAPLEHTFLTIPRRSECLLCGDRQVEGVARQAREILASASEVDV